MNSLTLPAWWRAGADLGAAGGRGFWYRLSHAVMRRPGSVALAAAAVVLIGLPFGWVAFTGVDASVLPAGSEPRQVEEAMRAEFPPSPTEPITVALAAPRRVGEEVRDYTADLAALEGVEAVAPPRSLGDRLWQVDVVPGPPVLEERTLELIHKVRTAPAPGPVQVAGQSARFVDQQAGLADRLPLALAVLAGTTLLILFVMTGSVILPTKALVMNLLTLSGAFGVLVLVFQDGRLEALLDYTSQGRSRPPSRSSSPPSPLGCPPTTGSSCSRASRKPGTAGPQTKRPWPTGSSARGESSPRRRSS